jgi:F-type H+-transporting ATPase subunit b
MPLLLVLLQEGGHEAGGGGGGGPFSINPGLIIWTLVVFGILMVLLWRLAWPSILKSVEERERRIQKQLEDAERVNAEAQRLLEDHKKTIAGARTEAQEMIAKAKAVSQKERELLLAKAREEYEAILARARKDIDAEKEKAIVALRREAVELSIAAASRVIDANLDTEANRRLVTDYLGTLDNEQKR